MERERERERVTNNRDNNRERWDNEEWAAQMHRKARKGEGEVPYIAEKWKRDDDLLDKWKQRSEDESWKGEGGERWKRAEMYEGGMRGIGLGGRRSYPPPPEEQLNYSIFIR